MKYWESKEKIRDPKGRLSPNVSMGDSSAMTVTQHMVTRSPYVPSVQSQINPFLDAGKKNDLSKLKVRIASSVHFFSDRQFTLILQSLFLIYLSKSVGSIL